MKDKLIASVLLGLALAMATVPASARDLKIGVVDIGKLVSSSPQAQQARANMKSKFSKRKKTLEDKGDKLKSDIKRLKRDGSVMSDDARDSLESNIRDQQRRLKLLQDEYNDDVNKAEKDELESLRDKIRDVLNDYAAKNGYDLILGNGVLYTTDQVDVTDQVLKRLKASR